MSLDKPYSKYNILVDNFGIDPQEQKLYIISALRKYDLKKCDLNNAKEVEYRIRWYFNLCEENDIIPTPAGVAQAIGITAATLRSWYEGSTRRKKVEYQEVAGRALTVIEEILSTLALKKKIDNVSFIFLSKNYFGLQDKRDYTLSANANTEGETAESVRHKYADIMEADSNSEV